MKERPILFKAEMVHAILEGRKTQTRRAMRHQPLPPVVRWILSGLYWLPKGITEAVERQFISTWPGPTRCPYGQPGDNLWVKETWKTEKHAGGYDGVHDDDSQDGIATICYRSDGALKTFRDLDDKADSEADRGLFLWRPSIFMPRWASRITLEIVAIRVERLLDISEADAKAEGIVDGGCTNCGESSFPDPCGCSNPSPDFRDAYAYLWHTINGTTGPNSWHYNPWVWAIEFKRVTP